jgi:hypothetical protein
MLCKREGPITTIRRLARTFVKPATKGLDTLTAAVEQLKEVVLKLNFQRLSIQYKTVARKEVEFLSKINDINICKSCIYG